jgi:excinuclease UvrABC nuclease subunit
VDLPKLARKLEQEMKAAAKVMDFERAAQLRDQLMTIQQQLEKRRTKSKK